MWSGCASSRGGRRTETCAATRPKPASAVNGAMGKVWLAADPVVIFRTDSDSDMESGRVELVGEIACAAARAARPSMEKKRPDMLTILDAGIAEQEQERKGNE